MTTPTAEQLATIQAVAQSYTTIANRTPIVETPADYGLDFENVKYPTADGVELAAWFIPAPKDKALNKLIICNHPATFSRYGFPGHQAPWSDFQNVKVTFGKVYKALHQAGYDVLTYDFRQHGESGSTAGNLWGQGFYDEYKDVLATFDYVQSQPHLQNLPIGLFNPCAGGNAAMHAMTKHPEYFANVKAFVCAQPASINVMANIALNGMGLGDFSEDFAEAIHKNIGIRLDAMTPHLHAKNIQTPTFIVQNKDDAWTVPDDVQTTFDLIPTADKKLFWIEQGDNRRFIGYNYLGDNPQMMLEWFHRYL